VYCIGLTGGIGFGKTTAARLFAELGAGIIDTDAIAAELTRPGGEAIDTIIETFGYNYVTCDGALDRKKMREAIFSDPAAKRQLEIILHPLILKQARAQLMQMQNRPYVIIVVPLLLESPSFRRLVQRVVVVDCQESIQIERVIKRNGMTAKQVSAIIAQQVPRDVRLQHADDLIRNDEGLDKLAEQVANLHDKYLSLASGN
jgi:dephospho-CoA kinase